MLLSIPSAQDGPTERPGPEYQQLGNPDLVCLQLLPVLPDVWLLIQTNQFWSVGRGRAALPPGQSRVPSYSQLARAIAAVGIGVGNAMGLLEVPGMCTQEGQLLKWSQDPP